MQTSSVDEFNNLFAQLEQRRLITQVLQKTGISKQSLTNDQVFQLAEQKYLTMSESSTWTGLTTRGSESVFKSKLVGEKKYECFNCGGNHSLKECTQHQSEERIPANRKKFRSNKRKGTSGGKKKTPGKYSGPKAKERGRRIIDGYLHYYHHQSRRWKVVDRPEEVDKPASANVSTTTNTTDASTLTAITKQTTPDIDDSSKAGELLRITNVKKQFKTTLQGMMAQLE